LFPEPVFLEVPLESVLVENDVFSRQTGITSKKGQNFLSDRWIALKVLQLFPDPVFLEALLESLLVENEVLLSQTRIIT
jgi:hypothetical protein